VSQSKVESAHAGWIDRMDGHVAAIRDINGLLKFWEDGFTATMPSVWKARADQDHTCPAKSAASNCLRDGPKSVEKQASTVLLA
jgi:hypothetical protein